MEWFQYVIVLAILIIIALVVIKVNQKDLLNALIWTMRSHLSFFLPYSSSKRFGDLYANV